jgi:hypothetical protein
VDETWKAIPGFGRYEVSDQGQVRSWVPWRGYPLPRTLTPIRHNKGYRQVKLQAPAGLLTRKVHILVLAAFVGPMPAGKQTRHLNGNPADNRLVNLTYGTASENVLDQVEHGTHHKARVAECPQGHPYDADNTRPQPGGRACRTCMNNRSRQYMRHRAARKREVAA